MTANQEAKTIEILFANCGERILFMTEPKREIAKLIPNANANSFPLNQLLNNVEFPTIKESEPNPKTKRPRKITGQLLIINPNVKITCPIVKIQEKVKRQLLYPNLIDDQTVQNCAKKGEKRKELDGEH